MSSAKKFDNPHSQGVDTVKPEAHNAKTIQPADDEIDRALRDGLPRPAALPNLDKPGKPSSRTPIGTDTIDTVQEGPRQRIVRVSGTRKTLAKFFESIIDRLKGHSSEQNSPTIPDNHAKENAEADKD